MCMEKGCTSIQNPTLAIACRPEMAVTATTVSVGTKDGMVQVVASNFPRQGEHSYHNGWWSSSLNHWSYPQRPLVLGK